MDRIKKVKRKGRPIILTKYVIIHFCNIRLGVKDVCYIEYYKRIKKIPPPTKFLQHASQETPKYSPFA